MPTSLLYFYVMHPVCLSVYHTLALYLKTKAKNMQLLLLLLLLMSLNSMTVGVLCRNSCHFDQIFFGRTVNCHDL